VAHQTTSFIHWSLILDSYHVRLSPDIKHYLTWLDLVVGCYGSLHLLSILQVCCDPPHSSIQFMALFAGSFSTYWQILTASLGELEERPPGHLHTTWMKTEDYPEGPEINEPLPQRSKLMWLRIIHSGELCLHLALCTHSGACQKWMNEWQSGSKKWYHGFNFAITSVNVHRI